MEVCAKSVFGCYRHLSSLEPAQPLESPRDAVPHDTMSYFSHTADAPPAGRPVEFDPSSNKPILPGDPNSRRFYARQSQLHQSQRHHYNEPPNETHKPRPRTLAELMNRGPTEESLPPAAGSPTHATPASTLLAHGDALGTRPAEERMVLGMTNEQANGVFLRRGEQQTRGSVRPLKRSAWTLRA